MSDAGHGIRATERDYMFLDKRETQPLTFQRDVMELRLKAEQESASQEPDHFARLFRKSHSDEKQAEAQRKDIVRELEWQKSKLSEKMISIQMGQLDGESTQELARLQANLDELDALIDTVKSASPEQVAMMGPTNVGEKTISDANTNLSGAKISNSEHMAEVYDHFSKVSHEQREHMHERDQAASHRNKQQRQFANSYGFSGAMNGYDNLSSDLKKKRDELAKSKDPDKKVDASKYDVGVNMVEAERAKALMLRMQEQQEQLLKEQMRLQQKLAADPSDQNLQNQLHDNQQQLSKIQTDINAQSKNVESANKALDEAMKGYNTQLEASAGMLAAKNGWTKEQTQQYMDTKRGELDTFLKDTKSQTDQISLIESRKHLLAGDAQQAKEGISPKDTAREQALQAVSNLNSPKKESTSTFPSLNLAQMAAAAEMVKQKQNAPTTSEGQKPSQHDVEDVEVPSTVNVKTADKSQAVSSKTSLS